MAPLMWLSVQAAGAAGGSLAEPIDFDLARVKPIDMAEALRRCRSEAGEIVVCGRRRGDPDYPYAELERRYREEPLRAEAGIGAGATARAFVDQVAFPTGEVSKRIMVGVKLPF